MSKKHILLSIFLVSSVMLFSQRKHETRMVWIATLNNIDWPPKDSFEPTYQQAKMIEMLDTFKNLNINTIILQIRPTADALYQSNEEEWSRFLTGTQGTAPYPYYDPLRFVIAEAHKRNIDVHVWLNPYRLLNNDNLTLLSNRNIFFKNPDTFIKYGGQYFFNPAKKETLEHIKKVVKDIVSRYDIEAIHIDDYFYPYPVRGEKFPDDTDFAKDPRGFSNKNDWRRDNVNKAIDVISSTIKETKDYVEFGVSPFGVWRNKSKDPRGSETRAMSNYDDLYADILKWIEENKIDYVIPQLYWEIGHKYAEYNTLAKWWNNYGNQTNIYIGLYASNLGNKSASKSWLNGNELCRQMELNTRYENIKGVGLYSAIAIMENRQGIADSLRNNYFKYHSLVMPSPKSKGINPPQEPQKINIKFDYKNQKIYLTWDTDNDTNIKYFIIYYSEGVKKIDTDNPKNIFATTREKCLDITSLIKKKYDKRINFGISSVNRYNIESKNIKTIKY